MNYDLITILGPTASGKTPLAAAWLYNCMLKSSVVTVVRYIGVWTWVQGKIWQIML